MCVANFHSSPLFVVCVTLKKVRGWWWLGGSELGFDLRKLSSHVSFISSLKWYHHPKIT